MYKQLSEKDPSNLLLSHFVQTYQEPVKLIEKRRLKKLTMDKVKAVANGLENYYMDEQCYVKSGIAVERLPEGKIVYVTFKDTFKDYPQSFGFRVPTKVLLRMLSPSYAKDLSIQDGWGDDMEVLVNTENCPQQYLVRSAGSNGSFDANSYISGSMFADDKRDILLSNGQFIEWPQD
jgi:hypothetical protein